MKDTLVPFLQSIVLAVVLAILACTGFAAHASTQSSSHPISPQALAGDWEYSLGAVKLVLHLSVNPDGSLAGIVDTPDSPPKHITLSNVHLSGNTLVYTFSGLGAMTEVIKADGKSMIGPYMWERANTAAISSQEAAGDWQSTGMVLRLRLDPSGSLTGAIDLLLYVPRRVKLHDVQINGKTISGKSPDGNALQGTFSNDGQTIVGNPMWTRTRTLAQALAEDAKEKSMSTDGTWTGVIDHIVWSEQLKPPYDTTHLKHPYEALHVTFHLNSAPASCSVDIPEEGGAKDLRCEMKLDGNKVHMNAPMVGVFDGVLNGAQLTGTWMPSPTYSDFVFNPQAEIKIANPAMAITLTRTASPAN